MPSAFISSRRSYPAMLLAEQLVHQRSVHPGPLVLRTAPFKSLTPATDRDRTVSPVSYTHLRPDQRVQSVGGRFSVRPIGRDDLKLSNGRILQFPQIECLNLRRGFFLIFCLDELKIRTVEQAAVFLVDEFGVVGDQAVLGLTENLIENRHRHDAASDQLREHIARADALQPVSYTPLTAITSHLQMIIANIF